MIERAVSMTDLRGRSKSLGNVVFGCEAGWVSRLSANQVA